MTPWTTSYLIFHALVLGLASQDTCPVECQKPHCVNGAPWNGGKSLAGNVCEHLCSKKFGETRYCGSGDKYAAGSIVNCTLCKASVQKPAVAKIEDTLRIREAILEEARDRLINWYHDEDQLTLPYWETRAKVRQTKHWYLCDAPDGDMKVPITFGEFNVSDVRPAQLFNILVDIEGQLKWDESMSEAKIVKEFPEDGVVAADLGFPSGFWLVPPREVFQWIAFNGSVEQQDYWFAVSSLNVEAIHKVQKPNKLAVQAQNCLGAYWIRPCPAGGEKICPSGNPYDCCPEGGSRIIFTSHVNVHPPGFLNAKTMFDLSWTKQIDWINSLKARAREVQKNETAKAAQTPVLPKWLWQDPGEPKRGSVPFSFPHAMVIAPSKLYERSAFPLSLHSTTSLFIFTLAAAASVLIFVVMRAHRTFIWMKEGHDSRILLARDRGEADDME